MPFFSGEVKKLKLLWEYYYSYLQGRSGLCKHTDFVKFIHVSIICYNFTSSEI